MVKKYVFAFSFVLLLSSAGFADIGQTHGLNVFTTASTFEAVCVGFPTDCYMGTVIQYQMASNCAGTVSVQYQIGGNHYLLPCFWNPWFWNPCPPPCDPYPHHQCPASNCCGTLVMQCQSQTINSCGSSVVSIQKQVCIIGP